MKSLQIIAIFFISLALTACDESMFAPSVVTIEISSGGINGRGKPPQLHITAPETQKICRRGGFPTLEDYNLNPPETLEGSNDTDRENTANGNADATDASTGTAGDTQDQGNSTSTDINPANLNITTSVSGNWFQIGLNIFHSKPDHWLWIKTVEFYFGNSRTPKPISESYCGGTGLGALYIIPPPHSVANNQATIPSNLLYEPNRPAHLNNLTIYVDGVPLPETPGTGSAGQRASSPQGGGDQGSSGGSSGGEGQGGSAGSSSSAGVLPEISRRRIVTPVVVRFKLIGVWTDKDQNQIAEYESVVKTFRIRPRFIN